MKIFKIMLQSFLLMAAVFTFSACSEDGPAEEMGENIDEMTQDTGNQIEDMCEDAKEGMNANDTDC